MKINIYIIAILFSLIFSNSDTLSVNIGKSHLYWTGQKVSGEHKGEVAIQEGYVIVRHGEILKAQIIVDMTTISVSDIESEEWNQKLVNHLKNDDFFGVDSFPTAILSIDSSKDYKSQLTPQYNSQLDGFLTIKNINNPIEILSNINFSEIGGRAVGTLKIDRTKFGIKYNSKSFFPELGDKFIYDEFILDFDIYTQ